MSKQALALLRNKWLWIALGVLVVFLIVRKNWPRWSRLWKPDYGRDIQQAGLTDQRKAELETLARSLYADSESWGTAEDDLWSTAAQLNDAELRYLAQFYENVVANGEMLATHLEDLWTLDGTIKNNLIARLRTLALA